MLILIKNIDMNYMKMDMEIIELELLIFYVLIMVLETKGVLTPKFERKGERVYEIIYVFIIITMVDKSFYGLLYPPNVDTTINKIDIDNVIFKALKSAICFWIFRIF